MTTFSRPEDSEKPEGLEKPEIIETLPRFWVVNKPPGWFSIPPRDPVSKFPTLLTWVEKELGPAWVVHRLDRETSGLILFARDAEAHRDANLWFSGRKPEMKVQKEYRFLAAGRPSFPQFSSSEPIEGKPSRTLFEVLGRSSRYPIFYGAARPQSGRRHQIRIHLQKLSFSICGDLEHGGNRLIQSDSAEKSLLVPRVLLHAFRLKLPTGEHWEAPLPQDFRAALVEAALSPGGDP